VDSSVTFSDAQDLADQASSVMGGWTPQNSFKPDRKFMKQPGAGGSAPAANPCPCNWPAKKAHLTKCNWFSCGPPPPGMSAQGFVKITRLKTTEEMVSDYQSEC